MNKNMNLIIVSVKYALNPVSHSSDSGSCGKRADRIQTSVACLHEKQELGKAGTGTAR